MHLILDIESLLKFIKHVNHVLMLVQVLFRRKNENENMFLVMLNARMQELLHLVYV